MGSGGFRIAIDADSAVCRDPDERVVAVVEPESTVQDRYDRASWDADHRVAEEPELTGSGDAADRAVGVREPERSIWANCDPPPGVDPRHGRY